MHKYFFISFLFLFLSKIQAQDIKGVAKYMRVVKSQTDIENDLVGQMTETYLYFDQNKSMYKYFKKKNKEKSNRTSELFYKANATDAELKELHKDDMEILPSNSGADPVFKDKLGHLNYKNFSKRKMITREIPPISARSTEFYIIEEPLPDLDWKILEGKKQIGQFFCRQATVSFRGRDYEAWFTLDIPVSTGPWKFWGLPGLILEIKSLDQRIAFKVRYVKIPYDIDPIYFPKTPKREKQLSLNEYIQEVKRKKQIIYYESIVDENSSVKRDYESADIENIFQLDR